MHLGRAALSGAFFVAYGAFALPFAAVLMLPIWSDGSVRFVVRWFYKSFVFLAGITHLYEVQMVGADVLGSPRCRGKIIVANHISLIDICVLIAKLPDSTVIVKSSLRKNPFLAMVAKKAFIVNDERIDSIVSEVRDKLRRGINVIVFPQGTRGGIVFHRGAARLALAAGVPLHCIHLDYDPPVLTKQQSWWDVGNREIMIKLSDRGEIPVKNEFNNHHNAVVLTEKIKEKLK